MKCSHSAVSWISIIYQGISCVELETDRTTPGHQFINAIGACTAIPGSTRSEATFAKFADWLHVCESSHSACNVIFHKRCLPLRMLAFRGSGHAVVLQDLDNDFHEPYACLSHCWGSNQPLMTMTLTHRDRKTRISWKELPQTFQDAIIICQSLGIMYIWIDSLCIIQDDEQDWLHESAKMASVYSGARLTIAASSAHNDTEGCFKVSDIQTHKISIQAPDGSMTDVYARRELPHFGRTARSLQHWLLMQRAWAYQERLLSPRVLHFGPHEVVWECREASLCECSGIDS